MFTFSRLMKLITQKTAQLNGTITIPSSKSQSVRGLLMAMMASGESILHNFLEADDTEAALQICKDLGVQIQVLEPACHSRCLKVVSEGLPLQSKVEMLNSGNSGITTRFIMPILGLRSNPEKPVVLDCGEQMKARPIHSLIRSLNDMGMKVEALEKDGQLPVRITGTLKGGSTTVDGITSQFLSALLLACGCADGSSKITVKDLNERPYVEMTLKCLADRGIRFQHLQKNDEDVFELEGGQKFKPFNAFVPGDFSSASYFLAAGALIPGQIVLKGLDMSDPQGDKRLIEILKEMGADIILERENNEDILTVRGGRKLKGVTIDANDIPDLLPTLAVIGTQAEGKTEIINVAQARLKETDRIHSMTEGLRKMGAKIEEKKDGMIIYQSRFYRAQAHGYFDHRTIMALAVAGLLAEGETEIDTAEGINKTFPDFPVLMKSIGTSMECW